MFSTKFLRPLNYDKTVGLGIDIGLGQKKAMHIMSSNKHDRNSEFRSDKHDKPNRIQNSVAKNKKNKKKKFMKSSRYDDDEIYKMLNDFELFSNDKYIHEIFTQIFGDRFDYSDYLDYLDYLNYPKQTKFILRDHQCMSQKDKLIIRKWEQSLESKNIVAAYEWIYESHVCASNDKDETARIIKTIDTKNDNKNPQYYVLKQQFSPMFFTIQRGDEKACIPVFKKEYMAQTFCQNFKDIRQINIFMNKNQNQKKLQVKRPYIPIKTERVKFAPFLKCCLLTGLDVLFIDFENADEDKIFQKVKATRRDTHALRGVLDYLYITDVLPEGLEFEFEGDDDLWR